MKDLLEALCRDQSDARTFRLQHGVRRNRRAVEDVPELADADPRLVTDPPHADEHTLRRIARCRRRLHPELRRTALVVHEEEIGEGAPDVDPKPVRHLLLSFVQPATGANVPAL